MIANVSNSSKNRLSAYFAALAIFLLFASLFSSSAKATPDTNNFFDSAEAITAPCTKTGTLDVADDESDFFAIYVPSGTISISLDVPSTGDFDIYIYDWQYYNETGYAIAAAETENDPETIDFTVPSAGTYFIELYAYSGSGAYTMTLSVSGGGNSDGNDNLYTATHASLGTTYGEITSGEKYDCYKYNITTLGVLTVILTGPANPAVDLDLSLYDDDFVKVGISEGDTSNELITYAVPSIGIYYVEVYAYAGNGAYVLNVTLSTAPVPGGYDDDFANARFLAMPSTINDNLARGSDNNDYYKFTAERGDTVYLNLTSPAGADFDVYLYDSGYSTIGESEKYTGLDTISEKLVSGGLYYVRVYAYAGAGAYSLQANINFAGASGVMAYIKSNASVVNVGMPVTLDASSSLGCSLSYSWDFDSSDGITCEATEETVTHSWSTAGTYTVTLDVKDRNNNTDYTTITITVSSSSAALPEWTVMVFLNADNNLEDAGIVDFNEMETIGSTSNMNVVVQMDRNPDYDTSNGDTTGVRRYLVKRDSNPSTITSPVLAYLGELNMGSGDVLYDFVKWAATSYPAKKYCLIIWDHGGGINGASYDESSGDDALEPIELKDAIKNAQDEGVPTIDLLGFDACLMANIEVAYELSSVANYMVASEEVEPGDGWPYNTVLGALATTPTMGPIDLGKVIVDKYKEFYEASGDYKNTMALHDLSRIGALSAKVNVIADILLSGLESSSTSSAYLSKMNSARNSVANYYSDTHIDLSHFVYLISSIDAVNSASADFTALKNAAVIYNYAGSANANSKGLSIYFPTEASPKSCTFNTIFHWDEMVAKYQALDDSGSNWPWRGSEGGGDGKQSNASVISGVFSTQSKPTQGTPTTLTLKLSNSGEAVPGVEIEVTESIPNSKNSTTLVDRKGTMISANVNTEITFSWIPKYSWEVELCARVYPAGNNHTTYATIKQQMVVTTNGPDIMGSFRNDTEGAIEGLNATIWFDMSNAGTQQISSGEVFFFDYTDRWVPVGYAIVDSLGVSGTKFACVDRAFSYGAHRLGAYVHSKEDTSNDNDWAFTNLYAYTTGVDLIPSASFGGNLLNGSISVNVTAWNFGFTSADNVVVRIYEETYGLYTKRQLAESAFSRVNFLSSSSVICNVELSAGAHLINVTLECVQDAHQENNFYSRYVYVGSTPGPCDVGVSIIGVSTKNSGNHTFAKSVNVGDKVNVWLAINNSGPGSASVVSIAGHELGTNVTIQGGIIENLLVGNVYYYTLIWTASSTSAKGILVTVSSLNETNTANDIAQVNVAVTEGPGLFGIAGCTILICIGIMVVGVLALIAVVALVFFVLRAKRQPPRQTRQ